jgi:hypothetical protein
MQKTADLDVRPKLISDYRIKFKAEMLPLKDEIGGLRMLYAHNVQFPLSQVHEADRSSVATLVRLFPPLQALQTSEGERVDFVHHTAVAEVLLDIGMLDFGKGSQPRPMWQCGGRAATRSSSWANLPTSASSGVATNSTRWR